MSVKVELRFVLNGKQVRCATDPGRTLLSVLRQEFGLQAARLGCGEGECGACAVMLDGLALNACITLAVRAQGRAVVTAEGLHEAHGGLAAVPAALVEKGAVQCGYCMSGIAISGTALLARHPGALARAEIARALEGHLCRCSGYKQAVDAIEAAAERRSPR